jgi:hypothetical protein
VSIKRKCNFEMEERLLNKKKVLTFECNVGGDIFQRVIDSSK